MGGCIDVCTVTIALLRSCVSKFMVSQKIVSQFCRKLGGGVIWEAEVGERGNLSHSIIISARIGSLTGCSTDPRLTLLNFFWKNANDDHYLVTTVHLYSCYLIVIVIQIHVF